MKAEALWKRYGKWMQLMFAAALVVCAGATLHDMQTAEGTGLYLSFQAGASDRTWYDLAVDAVGIVCLLVLLLLPCILLKRLRIAAFCRFSCACFAFLPVVSTASLVHLADGTEEILLRQAFSEGAVWKGMLEGVAGILPVLAIGIPLLLLAAAAVRTEEAKAGEEALRLSVGLWPRIWPGVLAVQILLLAGAVLFPALTDPFIYLIVYLLLIYGFSLWERLCRENPEWNTGSWILFGIFWLRGMERMLELMSVYHL